MMLNGLDWNGKWHLQLENHLSQHSLITNSLQFNQLLKRVISKIS